MEFLDNYSEEDGKSIMATLQVVQSKGWSATTDDQYQFHIILGSAIRCYELKIEQLEKDLENTVDETNQKIKEFKDMKNELRQEREINEELLDDVKRSDEEIKHLQECVHNRDDIANSLEEVFKERTKEIENLKGNCERLAVQVGKELILEKKLNIQNGVIKELRSQLTDFEKQTDVDNPEEIKTLMTEIEKLEDENKQKVNQLKKVHEENAMMQEKLKFLEENKKELIDDIEQMKSQNLDSVSLSEELNSAKTFKCGRCDENFGKCRDLKSHMRNEHENRDNISPMKLKLHQIEKQILKQKLNITNKIANLKEREFLEQQTCRCRGWCGISHKKHSWKITKSEKIFKMINDMCLNLVV